MEAKFIHKKNSDSDKTVENNWRSPKHKMANVNLSQRDKPT